VTLRPPAIRLCEGGYGIARTEWRLIAALVESGPLSPWRSPSARAWSRPHFADLAKLRTKGYVQREPDPAPPQARDRHGPAAGQRLIRSSGPSSPRSTAAWSPRSTTARPACSRPA
jgi:hypothetical protein